MTSTANRVCIGQLVRPDGTVISAASTVNVPSFGGPTIWGPPEFQITGAVYGRWRYADETEWRVTYYWPDGPLNFPAFADHTGEGRFHSMNPDDPAMERDEAAEALRMIVTP